MNQSNCIVAQSGGPTVAINASLAGVIAGVKSSEKYDICYGAVNGILGILNENYLNLSDIFADDANLEKLKTTPAMYLGSCRHKLPDYKDDDSPYVYIFHQFDKLSIKAFFYIGGNDSMDTVLKLSDYAKKINSDVKIIGIPKTIDNDLCMTDHTPGFGSAAKYVASTMLEIAHDTYIYQIPSVVIVEIMGHKVGWLALYAGIAGGADIILLPEIPYDIDVVVNAIRSRTKNGKNFTILAVAEGAISKENAALTKKELKEKKKNGPVYPSVAYELGAQISERTGQEIRVTVPGHMQRGGEPCPYDRVIATRLGAEAAEMIRRKEYGYMVALNNNKIEKIPLADIAGKLKMVDPKSDIIREAKDVGISFGDE